jgi:hypothetical protein
MRTIILCLVYVLAAASAGRCQEARGSITGKVVDPQGAVIPGAIVLITNIETNLVVRTSANETGYFEVNLLNAGTYSIAVEAAGFRRSVRSGVVLNVGGRLGIDFELQLGQVAESIEVTAAAPLLDTTSASGGRVIDNREVMHLPVGDMNPFALSVLSPGIYATGKPEERRPFDSNLALYAMGGVGQTEYTMDGAPVTGTNRRAGFMPPSDAVAEFKLETTPFDASYGHLTGAVINLMTKVGTNTYHGSLYDQHWQERWNATRHFTRLAFEDEVRRGTKKPGDPK